MLHLCSEHLKFEITKFGGNRTSSGLDNSRRPMLIAQCDIMIVVNELFPYFKMLLNQ